MATESALLRFLTTTTVLSETSNSASFALAAGSSALAIGLAGSPGLAGVGSLPPDASGGFNDPHPKASPITKPAATANTVPRVMATPPRWNRGEMPCAAKHRVELPLPSTTTNTNQSAEGGGQLQLFVRRLY